MKQSGFAPILIVLLIAAAVGGYFAYTSLRSTNDRVAISPAQTPIVSSTPQPSPSPADETSNWKTYIDQEKYYSVKYPPDWNYTFEGPGHTLILAKKGFQGSFGVNVVDTALENLNLDLIAQRLRIKGEVKDIIVGGVKGKTVNFKLPSPFGDKTHNAREIEIIHHGRLYKLGITYSDTTSGEIPFQILSTFKFLDSTETNNSKISPDGFYIVSESLLGDYNTITLKDSNGGVIVDDLVAKNSKELGYNVKYRCMCATYFKSWVSNEKFSIKVINGGGEEYEFMVNAKVGKVDESSFKRIK